jgi:transposase
VKTNRRDAIALAKLLRAGELTAVWVPDEGHEAMRDLVRGRAAAVEALRVHRQQVSAFMLKHGRIFPRKKGWTMRYLRWLQEQKFQHPAHQIVLQENGRSGSTFERASGTARADDRGVCAELVVSSGRSCA